MKPTWKDLGQVWYLFVALAMVCFLAVHIADGIKKRHPVCATCKDVIYDNERQIVNGKTYCWNCASHLPAIIEAEYIEKEEADASNCDTGSD